MLQENNKGSGTKGGGEPERKEALRREGDWKGEGDDWDTLDQEKVDHGKVTREEFERKTGIKIPERQRP